MSYLPDRVISLMCVSRYCLATELLVFQAMPIKFYVAWVQPWWAGRFENKLKQLNHNSSKGFVMYMVEYFVVQNVLLSTRPLTAVLPPALRLPFNLG